MTTAATLSVREETFEDIRDEWSALITRLPEAIPFVTPAWQRCWLDHFQGQRALRIYCVRESSRLTGVLPLLVEDTKAEFVGHHSICDYMDAVIEPGAEPAAWAALLERVAADGIRELDLRGVLSESPTSTAIAAAAEAGWDCTREREAISPGVALPGSWEEYLGRLSKKDRHEMRRKLRRLDTAGGDVSFRVITEAAEAQSLLERFFHLMRISNHHKEEFLARPGMESFFRDMTGRMADAGMLRFHWLTFDNEPVAGVLNFDVGGRLYMYNSGYDPAYSHYAVGLMSKALLIQEAIECGRTFVDFMRGDESYKYDLGGQDRVVWRIRLAVRSSE